MQITSIEDLIAATNVATSTFQVEDPWWRGQARHQGCPLKPRAHRPKADHIREANLIRRFRQRAPSRTPNAPMQEDLISWLFLAQHYRLPTRLLDWTELPLVAAFFAVSESKHKREDGVLYALDPSRLNERIEGEPGVAPAQRPSVYPLFKGPYDDGVPPSADVAAVIATEIDPRMMVQRSAFTIHGELAPPLEQMQGSADFLVRFDIPSGAKDAILLGLRRLGVTWAALFPDLENLAREIEELRFPPA